jgi:uncharacterized protein
MPRLVVIGDVHFAMQKLAEVLAAVRGENPDGILLVGDLGSEADLRTTAHAVLREVAALGAPVAFVPGNHDLPELGDHGIAVNADDKVLDLAGLRVWGIGGAGPNRWGFPYEWTETMLHQRDWHDADIVLAHCPPRRCSLDRTGSGGHAGSQAIREILEQGRCRMLICGHIHEASGCAVVEDVVCLNAGALGEPYGTPQYSVVQWGDTALEVRHVVLPYEDDAEPAAWLRGWNGRPPAGVHRWNFGCSRPGAAWTALPGPRHA